MIEVKSKEIRRRRPNLFDWEERRRRLFGSKPFYWSEMSNTQRGKQIEYEKKEQEQRRLFIERDSKNKTIITAFGCYNVSFSWPQTYNFNLRRFYRTGSVNCVYFPSVGALIASRWEAIRPSRLRGSVIGTLYECFSAINQNNTSG